MTDLWTDLLDCLELKQPDSGELVFTARSQQLGYHRIFGGQLLGQFTRAAVLACPGKTVKSLHVQFPRAGVPEQPVEIRLTVHHEGGTFASLNALAVQPERGVIATASLSLHAPEDGPDHAVIPPLPPLPGPEHRKQIDMYPWDVRATTELDTPDADLPDYDLWFRTPEVCSHLAPALTAYATDLNIIGTALRQVPDITQRDAQTRFRSAVTTHTLSFHRPFRTDQGWLLLRHHSPIVAHGRAWGRGDVYTESGDLAASFSQESLVRFNT